MGNDADKIPRGNGGWFMTFLAAVAEAGFVPDGNWGSGGGTTCRERMFRRWPANDRGF